jgi:peptide deformylase
MSTDTTKGEIDMGLRKILTTKDPALHKVCKPVTAFDEKLHKLLDDMRETLIDSNGVGLAAPQVGILRRIFLVDVGLDGEQIIEFINPEILQTEGEQDGPEGCLSVPGRYGLVKRPYWVKIRAQDRDGNWFEAEGEELIGRCFCHENDHLDGIVYTEVMERFLTDEELEGE